MTTALFLVIALSVTQATAQLKGKAKKTPLSTSVQKPGRGELENLIRNYLLENPEVIRDALQALQVKEEQQRNLATAGNIKKFFTEIYADAESPVTGNSTGDISVVVFYDYFCGYCKKMLPELQTLIAKDKSVRVIYKELPIMGEQSLIAAKAALAASRQGKFEAFHNEMLASPVVNDEKLKVIAAKLGLDYERLTRDMNDPAVAAAIQRSASLAAALNIEGTPAYLIGDEFIPGAIGSDALARIVAAQREKLARSEKVAVGQR